MRLLRNTKRGIGDLVDAMNDSLIARLLSSVVLITLIAVIIFVAPVWVFALVVTLFIAMGLYELFSLIEKKGIQIFKYLGILIGIAIPVLTAIQFEFTKKWELAFIVTLCLGLFLLQFTRRRNDQAVAGISTTLFGILYVAWFFSYIIKLRLLTDHVLPDGRYLVAYLLLVTKSGDVGAYIIGTSFGRHALIPRISPKKSIEGTIGGFVFAVTASVLSRGFFPLPYKHLLILGAIIAVIAQLGDLSESLIKRDCQVKDSGTWIPGLGGVLDIIDSLLFTAPIFYFYLRLLE